MNISLILSQVLRVTTTFTQRSADFIVSLVGIPWEEKHSLLILGHSAEKSHRSRRMRLRPSCGRDFPSCDRIDNNYGSTWYVRQLLRAYCWFAWTVTELERIRFFWSLTEKNGAKLLWRAGNGSKHGIVELLLGRQFGLIREFLYISSDHSVWKLIVNVICILIAELLLFDLMERQVWIKKIKKIEIMI